MDRGRRRRRTGPGYGSESRLVSLLFSITDQRSDTSNYYNRYYNSEKLEVVAWTTSKPNRRAAEL